MVLSLLLAAFQIVVTTAIHGVAMVVAMDGMRRAIRTHGDAVQGFHRVWRIASVVLVMFTASIIEAASWAGTYMTVGAISEFPRALYFSMVTYTTLGFGDVVLDPQWQVLSGFQAANGIIMFGWTTAVIVATVHQAYFGAPSSGDSHV
jgi:hypothetical protein